VQERLELRNDAPLLALVQHASTEPVDPSLLQFDAREAKVPISSHTRQAAPAAFGIPRFTTWPRNIIFKSNRPPRPCLYRLPSQLPLCRRAKVRLPTRVRVHCTVLLIVVNYADTARHECVSEDALQHLRTYTYAPPIHTATTQPDK
jgi:hypothetical protein